MPLVLHGVLGKTFKLNLGSLENHSSSLSCKCYEMPLSCLPLDCCVLVVTVRGMLLEAEPGLPCETANAVGKQDGRWRQFINSDHSTATRDPRYAPVTSGSK